MQSYIGRVSPSIHRLQIEAPISPKPRKYLGQDFRKIFTTVRELPQHLFYRRSPIRASDGAYFLRELLSDLSDDAYPAGLGLSKPRTVFILKDWRCRR